MCSTANKSQKEKTTKNTERNTSNTMLHIKFKVVYDYVCSLCQTTYDGIPNVFDLISTKNSNSAIICIDGILKKKFFFCFQKHNISHTNTIFVEYFFVFGVVVLSILFWLRRSPINYFCQNNTK